MRQPQRCKRIGFVAIPMPRLDFERQPRSSKRNGRRSTATPRWPPSQAPASIATPASSSSEVVPAGVTTAQFALRWVIDQPGVPLVTVLGTVAPTGTLQLTSLDNSAAALTLTGCAEFPLAAVARNAAAAGTMAHGGQDVQRATIRVTDWG